MRIVLLSAAQIGHRVAEGALVAAPGVTLAGILTTPPVLQMSYAQTPVKLAHHTRFDDVAAQAGCEIVELAPPISGDSCLAAIDRWKPDLLLVLGWYHNIPRRVRNRVAACLGIHGSLLPRYRGGAPIPWAIINGEIETGATLFHLEDDIDAGDIVDQRAVPIGPDDTCRDVLERVMSASTEMIRAALPRLAAGTAPRRPQDHSRATIVPQRQPNDGVIDWMWTARRVHDFVRAQTRPYPGAFTRLDRRRLYMWSTRVDGSKGVGVSGTIDRSANGAFCVSCGDQALLTVIEASIDGGDSFTDWNSAERAGIVGGLKLVEPLAARPS